MEEKYEQRSKKLNYRNQNLQVFFPFSDTKNRIGPVTLNTGNQRVKHTSSTCRISVRTQGLQIIIYHFKNSPI